MKTSPLASFLHASLIAASLAACASRPPAPIPPAPPHPLAELLVVQGALTEEGQRRRHAAQRLVATDHHAQAYAEWLPLAAAGHAESQFNLGLMTRQGLGTAVDIAASLQWMQRAAAAGHRDALLELGMRHASGTHGVSRNAPEALRLFLRAAELGDATAAFYAGQYLFYGTEVPGDVARGLGLLIDAAQSETPSIRAQSVLGRIYLAGGAIPADVAQARYWLEQAAAADDAEAQFHMGVLYQGGQGVPKNLHKAHGWYLRAAQQGYAAALNNIGILYRNGEGVKKNLVLARARFEDARARGNLDAAVNLGDLLFNGLGAPTERKRAVELFRTAAQASHGWGQCRYAQALLAGEGVPRAPAEAQQWMDNARQAGIDCKPLQGR